LTSSFKESERHPAPYLVHKSLVLGYGRGRQLKASHARDPFLYNCKKGENYLRIRAANVCSFEAPLELNFNKI